MNIQKTIKIQFSGSGTPAEIASSLRALARDILDLTDEEIEKGGDIENFALAGSFDEIDSTE